MAPATVAVTDHRGKARSRAITGGHHKILEKDDGMGQSGGRRCGERQVAGFRMHSEARAHQICDRTLAGWARAESRMTLVWRPRVQKRELLFVETVTTAGESAGWGQGQRENQ